MTEAITISLTLPPRRAAAFAEVIKRLQRSNIGPTGLNLANSYQPDEQREAELAIDELRRALADAGFEPR